VGEIYALLCALIWAFAVILFQRTGERVSPLALTLFRSSVSVPLLVGTLYLSGGSLLRAAPRADYLVLLASGTIGIAFADVLFHASLNRVGSGISAIVSTTYSPLIVLMAYFLLAERVRPLDLAGMGLIMSSVLMTGSLKPPPNRTHRQLLTGILIGVLDMVFLTFSIVLAKTVLDHSPVLWAAAIRQIGSLVVLLAMAGLSRRRREHFAVFRPAPHWRTMLPGAFLGSYIALIFWIAAMKYCQASIAAILTQTSTIFILLLAVLLLHESFSLRKGLAAVLAVGGTVLIMVF